jgi:hypothetical protein
MKTRKRVARATRAKRLEVAGGLDRRTAELLGLELAMLAKAHGLKVARVDIRVVKRTP